MIIEANDVRNVYGYIDAIVTKSSIVQAFEFIKIDFEKPSTLTIHGTNGAIFLKYVVDVCDDGDNDFSIGVSGETIRDILATMTGGRVSMKIKGDKFSISQGKTKFDLKHISTDNFPALPSFAKAITYDIQEKLILESFSRVADMSFSKKDGENNPVAFIEFKDRKVRIYHMSPTRIHVIDVDCDTGSDENKIVAIPTIDFRTIKGIVKKRIAADDDFAEFLVGDDRPVLTIKLGDGRLTLDARLIQMKKPNTSFVETISRPNIMRIDKESLTKVLKQLMIVSPDSTASRQPVDIIVDPSGKAAVRMAGDATSCGDFTSLLKCSYEGQKDIHSFFAKDLLEGISHMEDTITIEFPETLAAWHITDGRISYYMSPVRRKS